MKPKIWLKKGKAAAIARRHHWIFSGAISRKESAISNGDFCEVYDKSDKFLCQGFYHDANIAVRILSFEIEAIDLSFWAKRLEAAISLRMKLGLPSEKTTVYRLIHGEADMIPGLVIDIYNTTAVIQLHYPGLENHLNTIKDALIQSTLNIEAFIFKYAYNKDALNEADVELPILVKENGISFIVDPVKGQKTGFFIDQRDNRSLLASYAQNKSVLNLFSYTGGFSLYALLAGAKEVVSVDISAKAIEELERNIEQNQLEKAPHRSEVADVMDYIKEAEMGFDIIVIDPPAFAKHKSKRHKAIQAYKRLNAQVIKKCKPDTLLLTFSCSQVITKDIFRKTIYSAALESGRQIKVLKELNQAPDHPVNIYHPETDYLKGLLLFVH